MNGIYRPATVGAFVSVKDEAALTTIDVSGFTLGTFAFVVGEGAYFQLVLDGSDLIWQEVAFSGGTAHTSAPVSGDGSSGSPITMAAATDSTAGAMSAADKTRADANVLPASSTLGDASVTVNPATDAVAQYLMPDSTLTANRAVTFGSSGPPTAGMLVQVLREDVSGYTLDVNNGSGTMWTFPGSGELLAATFQFDADTSDWVFVAFYFVE